MRRELFVRPPIGIRKNRKTFWKLSNLSYGVVEAALQWEMVSDDWVTTTMWMSMVHGCGQFIMKRDSNGTICPILAMTVEDFLISGADQNISEFIAQLEQ